MLISGCYIKQSSKTWYFKLHQAITLVRLFMF